MDLEILKKLDSLPVVELKSEWENNILEHEDEIRKLLAAKNIAAHATFKHIVALNQPSKISREGKYWFYLVSLSKGKIVRVEGDDLWLIKNAKKEFSTEERKTISAILP